MAVAMIGADELAARIALDDEALWSGALPLVVVDLGSFDRVDLQLDGLPIVVVGIGDPASPIAGAVDVVTDDEHVVDAIEGAVTANPIAAVTLALLLRDRDGRTPSQALVAESTAYSMLQAGPEFSRWRARTPHRDPGPDPEPAVLVELDADVLRVTLNRPHRHNAYSMAMRDALVEALRVAVASPELRVVLDGSGPSFSSGGDLAEFGLFGDPASAHAVRLARSAARLLARLSERVEARVHGSCLGAGVELASFAHRVVAEPRTTFCLPELSLGLIPGAGGTASLPPRIGRHRTAQLALTGETIDAQTALNWGLVDELVA